MRYLLFISYFVCSLCEAQTSPSKTIIAIYESATVYAGSTDYVFTDVKTKEQISVRVLNIPEKGIKTPKIPAKMTVRGKGEVGFPEANPKMVGKRFKIVYNAQDEVEKVEKLP
jgi:hypothetical protein